MTETAKLTGYINDYERAHGKKPDVIKIEKPVFDRLRSELAPQLLEAAVFLNRPDWVGKFMDVPMVIVAGVIVEGKP